MPHAGFMARASTFPNPTEGKLHNASSLASITPAAFVLDDNNLQQRVDRSQQTRIIRRHQVMAKRRFGIGESKAGARES
jgi:hypothetical protein